MPKPVGWYENGEGRLPVGHILSWRTALGPTDGLMLICIAQNQKQVTRGGVALQLVIPAEQARRLSRDLAQIADLLDPSERTRQ